MVDAKGGGVMHVDFGCLFDRGLTLEVPEVVPFRLTQNVADACGVSGAEGAFRRAAEITLGVLRGSRAALMTTAETFLADPLVEWTKAHRGAGTELDNPMVTGLAGRGVVILVCFCLLC
jgi:serine/threonine-protein kinase ATR